MTANLNPQPSQHGEVDDAKETLRLSIPSKTFLLGEYAALQNGPAIIAATTPCFEIDMTPFNADKNTLNSHSYRTELFHPDSPAGVYLKSQTNNASPKMSHAMITAFSDPYNCAGGFGGSTAEFIAAYYSQKIHECPQPHRVRDAYRLHTQSLGKFTPSGYDILAQCVGKLCLISHDAKKIESINWPFQHLGFILFKTQQKIQTHVHLNALDSLDFTPLNRITHNAINALHYKNSTEFIEAVSEYADELRKNHLTCVETISLLSEISKNSHVYTAKGCGSLGADVIAVFCEHQHKNTIIDFAKRIGLTAISDDSQLHTGAAWDTRRE